MQTPADLGGRRTRICVPFANLLVIKYLDVSIEKSPVTVKTAQRLRSISISISITISIRVRILVELRIGRLFRCDNAYAHAITHADAYAHAYADDDGNVPVARFPQ